MEPDHLTIHVQIYGPRASGKTRAFEAIKELFETTLKDKDVTLSIREQCEDKNGNTANALHKTLKAGRE